MNLSVHQATATHSEVLQLLGVCRHEEPDSVGRIGHGLMKIMSFVLNSSASEGRRYMNYLAIAHAKEFQRYTSDSSFPLYCQHPLHFPTGFVPLACLPHWDGGTNSGISRLCNACEFGT